MISFIMMAKNVEEYIEEAVFSLQKVDSISWELVIVEDHSSDSTFDIITKLASNDNRIIAVKNKFQGKVLGTNYGYTLAKGDIIKCIDSDDILVEDFFKEYENLEKHDAHCHSAYIVDNKLNILGTYHVNTELIDKSYTDVIGNLISPPKWSWSFKREVAERIFPMPEDLPFEDVWISVVIKKYAKSIYNSKKPLYLYRQHGNQTFGGILNYNTEKIVFRAKRLVKVIEIIENSQSYLIQDIDNPFTKMKIYLQLQIEQASIISILKAAILIKNKLKLILMMHFPRFAVSITKLKWLTDKLK